VCLEGTDDDGAGDSDGDNDGMGDGFVLGHALGLLEKEGAAVGGEVAFTTVGATDG
jgi:hypothetical protein